MNSATARIAVSGSLNRRVGSTSVEYSSRLSERLVVIEISRGPGWGSTRTMHTPACAVRPAISGRTRLRGRVLLPGHAQHQHDQLRFVVLGHRGHRQLDRTVGAKTDR